MNEAIAQNNAFKHEECVPRPWIVEQVAGFKTPPTHGQMVTLEFMQRMEETGYGGLICSELGNGHLVGFKPTSCQIHHKLSFAQISLLHSISSFSVCAFDSSFHYILSVPYLCFIFSFLSKHGLRVWIRGLEKKVSFLPPCLPFVVHSIKSPCCIRFQLSQFSHLIQLILVLFMFFCFLFMFGGDVSLVVCFLVASLPRPSRPSHSVGSGMGG